MEDRLKTKVKELLSAGVPETEIAKYIQEYSDVPRLRSEEAIQQERTPEWAGKYPNLYGTLGAGKAIWEQALRPTMQAGGMAAGNIAGAPYGPVGIAGGGALGYGMAKKFTDVIDRQIGRLEGVKRRTSIGQESLKSLYDIKEGFEAEMIGQGTGKMVQSIGNAMGAPLSSLYGDAEKEILSTAKKYKIKLTPSDVIQSKSLSQGEALLEKIFGASDTIIDARLKGQIEPLTRRLEELKGQGATMSEINDIGKKIYQEVTDYLTSESDMKEAGFNYVRTKIIASLGTEESIQALGLSQKELLRAKSLIQSSKANTMYNKVGELLPGGISAESYTTPKLAQTARNILAEYKGSSGIDKKLLKKLTWSSKESEVPERLLNQLDGLPENLRQQVLADLGDEIKIKRSWQALQTERSELKDLIEAETAIKSAMPGARFQMTNTGRQYTRLRKAIDQELKDIAEQTGGEAWEQFQLANSFWGEMSEVYKSKIIRSMLKTDPEKLIDVAFKPNGLTEIQTIKKALSPQEFIDLRGGFTNKLVALDNKGVFDPKAFQKQIERYGDQTLKEIYGEATLRDFKEIAKKGIDLTRQTPHIQFLKSLSNKDPETLVDAIIGAPEAKIHSNRLQSNINRIKNVVSKETFKEVDDLLFEKLMQKHPETQLVRPQSFAKTVDKYSRVLKQINPQKFEQLEELSNMARRFGRAEAIAGNPSGTGQTIIGWLMYRSPIMGTVMSITSKQLAKIYTSKFGLKWLTEGFKVPENSRRGIEIATKLTKLLYGSEDTEE